MNRLENLTIALDVDGALSPVTPMGSGLPKTVFDDWSYRVLSPRLFGAVVAEEVIALLKTLKSDGAKIAWHTTWGETAPKYLSPEVELSGLELFADRSKIGDAPWWKLAAVENWIAATEGTDARLIWIDDDISDFIFQGEIPASVLHHPRVSLVSPNAYWGLGPADLEAITSAAYEGSRITLANDPTAPRPLPVNPGSVIAWGELEDEETGERWGATATAILTPEGGIVWGDAFIDAETPTSLFDPAHLNSVEWIPIIETVEADRAPDSIRTAFAEGDQVIGAVFTAKLDDLPEAVSFTTAPGVLYRDELSEVYAVDIYGNVSNGEEREALFLPTVLR